jgi:catechol 2,3-dioxygenase-like lactoylglutathione lyase family enzyme
VKTHLNLATSDLARGVEFYSVLLNAEPAKKFRDYALFVTEQPGLELALDLARWVSPTKDAHYGIFVESAAEVESAIARLENAGLATSIEREETCCYANQTKVWAVDPDGRRWEIYTVHEDTEVRDDPNTACCGATIDLERSCCAT